MLRSFVFSLVVLTTGAVLDIAMVLLGFGNHFAFLLFHRLYWYAGLYHCETSVRWLSRRVTSELASSLKAKPERTRERVEGQLHEWKTNWMPMKQELDITGQRCLIQSQKLAGLGELVASIGHDIGNPAAVSPSARVGGTQFT